MPMHGAKAARRFVSEEYKDLDICILDWYNSAIRFEGENRRSVEAFAVKVIRAWKEFACPACDILPYTGETPHNAVSPILRKIGKKYSFTMILRNNRTDERYPDGIFHVHPEYQNIKSEGIGLIEAMGLFFLPLIMAGIHLVFAFPLISKLLVLLISTDEKLLMIVTAVCFVVFALFYMLVYAVTSREYFRIVSGKKESRG